MRNHSLFAIIFIISLIGGNAWSQDEIQAQENSATWDHFKNLVDTIADTQQALRKARSKLSTAQLTAEREAAQAEVEQLNYELNALQMAWEMWATGGADVQMFDSNKEQEKFDWRDELESVFEPLLVELRRLTERPRKIERLRSEQLHFQQRLNAAERALENITAFRQQAPSKQLTTAFTSLEQRWNKRRDNLQNRLELVNFELRELLSPNTADNQKTIEAFQQLFTGRLLNLVLALLAAGIVYGLLWQINHIYTNRLMRRNRSPSFATRVIHLLLVIAGSLLSLLAGISVLYIRGDWILLGLCIILIVAIVLILQRSLPAYLNEAKLLLNIGPVREGERIIYNGLPWKVAALRAYGTLLNPVLTGGTTRLPLSELTSRTSRRYDEREPWFPSRENDYIVLSDDTFGKVILQTPEVVQLRVNSAVTSYPTASYLEQTPRNLSTNGFTVILRFGLDYQHQSNITAEIRKTLEDHIAKQLKTNITSRSLQRFVIEFEEAGASSLNFLGLATFSGNAAESYLKLKRLLQTFALEACNENGWNIPYNQLTVHLAKDESITPSYKSPPPL